MYLDQCLMVNVYKFACEFDDGVAANEEVSMCEGNGVVGCEALFGALLVDIVHRTGGEADTPPIG